MNLKALLNPQQYEAATYLGGHLRIIAGAGSGKTRVITYRIAYLIEEVGIAPRNILAITFTNKAANEMKTRVETILNEENNGTTICTIHSLCVRVLRQHSHLLGYAHNFVILDEEDQKSLLKKLIKEIVPKGFDLTPKSCIRYISANKTMFVDPDKAMRLAGNLPGEKLKAEVYAAYEKYNEDHNMMDFDDLLLKTLKIFQENPGVVDTWSRRYQYVHVDEFQDVGEIEYQLVHYFGASSIVCVVGDPDQTIYSFRGSDINFIMHFDEDYENTKTIILNQNYRSTKTILGVANNLIRRNRNRMEKDLFTELDQGAKVIHFSAASEAEEARYVCDTIEAIIAKEEGVNYRDFAVLYRANYLSRALEQEMIRSQIDYKIFGGLKFFNRKEVKDALSYIRLMVISDDLSFERICNVPARGVGNKTLERIQYVAAQHGITDYDALCFCEQEIGLKGKARKELNKLKEAIERARTSTKKPADAFEQLMIETGYMEMLKNDHEDSRLDNIMELKNSISNYMNTHPETPDFESYLQEIALYTTQDEATKDEYVSLMSIHMAKGLEFNYVFVCGLSEDIFPNSRVLEEGGDDGLEEERRLAYVAFTRAKKRLYLCDNQSFSYISRSTKLTSRFVYEIGKEFVEHAGKSNPYKTTNYIDLNPTDEDFFGDNGVEEWKPGDLCIHDKFGKGVVIRCKGETVDIAFAAPLGVKSIMAHHKALKRLNS
ncbi:MAG: UvrD-helicase domain-containing protein [Erysipelotrichaceae bacterium]|nr:UvrD-helicase domain-containing protein [Erysipelotrichaceae bacterium]